MAEDKTLSSSRSGSRGSSTKKAATKKTATKKTATKKAATKKTSSAQGPRKRAPRAEPAPRTSASGIAEAAARQLAELTTKDVEGVTGLQRTDDGWQVELEVLELRRIPTTTDVMATYELTLDSSGELEGYHRGRRYVRGQAEDGT